MNRVEPAGPVAKFAAKVPTGEFVLETRGVVKKFGTRTVLHRIELQLKKGDFMVLFGHNGAGKTTLLQVLGALMMPTAGSVRVSGYDTRLDREAIHRAVGVVSHDPYLYGNLTAWENLKFYGTLYDVSHLKKRIETILDHVGLGRYTHQRVQTFSRGMQQRLSFARAILHDPDILFLDEPFNGLDRQGVDRLKTFLTHLRDQGKTAVMASHHIERSLAVCSRIGILKSGRIVFQENTQNISGSDFMKHYFHPAGEDTELSAGMIP